MFDGGGVGKSVPSVGFASGCRSEIPSDERVRAIGRVIGHLLETDAAGAGPIVVQLNRADDQQLALAAVSAATGHGIILAAAWDLGFVDFDETGERGAAGRHHTAPQFATRLTASGQYQLCHRTQAQKP